MVRIWYSANGEGYGHATRSTLIIKELQKKHRLLITGFDKSYVYFKKRFPKSTHKIEGFGFVHEGNKINILKTVIQFISTFPRKSGKNMSHIFNLIKRFKPNLIISDFEPASHYLGFILGIPVISLDNMNVIARCEIDVNKEDILSYLSTLTVINFYNPIADYHLILTLKKFKKKRKNVFLFPPILRKDVLDCKPGREDFILVYQTSETNVKLVKEVKKVREKFVIYGMGEKTKTKNLVFKKFNSKNFTKDLSNCKAVIMTGGFTTISEAMYLKKPMLIFPSENQFEQKFNGQTVREMGIGDCKTTIDKNGVESFLSKLPYYRRNLESIEPWDNSALIKKLDELINELAPKSKPIFRFVRKIENLFRTREYERTLTMIKPDAVEKGLIGEVIKRLEKYDIKPVAMKMVKLDSNKAKSFYKHLKDKVPESVFNSLIRYISSDRIVLIVWQGNGVVGKVRRVVGPTDPKKSKKGNIRALSKDSLEKKFKMGRAVKNMIHASATIEEAKQEIDFFFSPGEILKP